MSYIVFKSQVDIALGLINYETKSFTTEGCTYDFVSRNSTIVDSVDESKPLYHMSYLYYPGKYHKI